MLSAPPPSQLTGNTVISLLLLLLVAILVVVFAFPPADWIPVERWGEWLEAQGMPGMSVLFIGGVLATAVGLPRQLLAFMAGLAYGASSGLFVSWLASLGGCALTVWVSQRLLSEWIRHCYPRGIAALERLVSDELFTKILVLRLQPLGTNLLTNLCVGLTSISRSTFLAASAVGYVPQMLVFSLLGSGIRVGSTTQLFVSLVLLLISLILALWLYRRHQLRSVLNQQRL